MVQVRIKSADGEYKFECNAKTTNGVIAAIKKNKSAIIDTCKLYCGSLTPGEITVHSPYGGGWCAIPDGRGKITNDVFGGRGEIELMMNWDLC